MKQIETLFQCLKKYNETAGVYPFHMPGHKRYGTPEEAESLYELDITEIDGFDNLHDAQGILKTAQDRTAALYHSEETLFSVNGSTAGLLASIAAVCEDGGEIMVARNCHKAVYHAIELHHLRPVYIYPQINTKYGINEGVYPLDVEKMWISHQNIQAIVITSPTYDGIVSDVRAICQFAHTHSIPVIVDEAHGAHFNFSDYFPKSAVQCGADIVIQSTHKTLPAMTQTAIVHMNGTLVDRARVRKMMGMYQTSSPSYVLMGSIDACMDVMERDGIILFDAYTDKLEKLRQIICQCKYIDLPGISDFKGPSVYDYDRSKLVLSVRRTGWSGQMLHQVLLKKYHLQMEMVSSDYVLAMTSVFDHDDGYERLVYALQEIDDVLQQQAEAGVEQKVGIQQTMSISPMDEKHDKSSMRSKLPVMTAYMGIWEAGRKKSEFISLSKAKGRVAGDYIYLYPPGIPLVTPGEIINEEALDLIKNWQDSGLQIAGIVENQINIIVDED